MENRIKELREERGLTMEGLAELAGTAAPTINKLEKGERKLHIVWMRRLATALRVAPADLLLDNDNPDRLDEAERRLVAAFRKLSPAMREHVLLTAMDALAAQAGSAMGSHERVAEGAARLRLSAPSFPDTEPETPPTQKQRRKEKTRA